MADVQHSSLYGLARNHRPLGANDGSGTDQPLILTSYNKAVQWLYPAGSSRPALQIDASGTTGLLPTIQLFANSHAFQAYDGTLIFDAGYVFGQKFLRSYGSFYIGEFESTTLAELATFSGGRFYLDYSGTNGAILPRMSTTVRDGLTAVAGMVIYNTTDSEFQWYTGAAWAQIAGGSTLEGAYNFGGAAAGRVIELEPAKPIVIRGVDGGATPNLIVRGGSGGAAHMIIGNGAASDLSTPEDFWKLEHDAGLGQFFIKGKGTGAGDTNEEAMITIEDDRSKVTIGNTTDAVDFDLAIKKIQLRGVDPVDGQVPAYSTATGEMEWRNAPRKSIQLSSSASVTITQKKDWFLSQYNTGAGTQTVNLPIGLDGDEVTITKTNATAFTLNIVANTGAGDAFMTGDDTATLSGDYASATFRFEAGSTQKWYLVALVGSIAFS